MNKLLLSICFVLVANVLVAQMFTPSASALPDGEINQTYGEQIIDFTVPASTTVSGEYVAQAIAIVFPAAAGAVGLLGLDNQTFDFNVTRTTLVMNGLPSGMTGNCDATPCTYMEGSSGYITIAGTPTQAGNFDVDIITLTEGEADISSLGGGFLDLFGIPSSFGLPTPVPTDLDETGYTLEVTDPTSITEVNEKYGLKLYPNPVLNKATFEFQIPSQQSIDLQIYNLSGTLVHQYLIETSANKQELDLSNLPKGSYLVKAQINSEIGLIRLEKK